jgi:Flp pilus assembly protein TadD
MISKILPQPDTGMDDLSENLCRMFMFSNPADAMRNTCSGESYSAADGAASALSLNIAGDELYQSGDVTGAAEAFQKALLLDPCDANMHNSLGVCYGVLKMYEAAEAEFQAAFALNPDEMMALYNTGVIYLLTDRRESALAYLLKAWAVDDGVFEVAILAGKLYLESGEPQHARSFLEKALNFRPNSGNALRTLAACYASLEMPHDAAALYSRAVKLNPQDAESLSMLGHLYDVIGENPEIALLFCQQSVAIAPENEIYRRRLDKLLAEIKRS